MLYRAGTYRYFRVVVATANDDEHAGEPGAADAEHAERVEKALLGAGMGVVAGWIFSD